MTATSALSKMAPRSSSSAGFVGDGQPFAAFGPTALQDNAPVLRVHPNKKPMGAAAAPTIGLKSTFHWTPGRVSIPWRNSNRNERRKRVSMFVRRDGSLDCLPQRPCGRVASLFARGNPAEVFHTCGKNCGNPKDLDPRRASRRKIGSSGKPADLGPSRSGCFSRVSGLTFAVRSASRPGAGKSSF